MGLTSFDEKQIYVVRAQLNTATALAVTTVGSATDGPRRVDAILASNNDTIAHVLIVGLNVSSSDTLVGSCTVPAGQGFGGTPALDVLAAAWPTTLSGIVIPTNSYIRVQLEVAMNTAKLLTLLAVGGYL